MSAQRLSDKSRRRIERATGLDLWRAWAHGGYTFDFCTHDHRHGWYDTKTSEWGFFGSLDRFTHYDTCREQFPGDFP